MRLLKSLWDEICLFISLNRTETSVWKDAEKSDCWVNCWIKVLHYAAWCLMRIWVACDTASVFLPFVITVCALVCWMSTRSTLQTLSSHVHSYYYFLNKDCTQVIFCSCLINLKMHHFRQQSWQLFSYCSDRVNWETAWLATQLSIHSRAWEKKKRGGWSNL